MLFKRNWVAQFRFVHFKGRLSTVNKSNRIADTQGMKTNASGTYEIARHSLEHNIISLKAGTFLTAGAHQFKTFWTRDFCLSSKGLAAIGRADVIRSHLEYLLRHRRGDDLVPLYVDSMNPVRRVIAACIFKALGMGRKSLAMKETISPYYLINGKFEVGDSNVLVLYAARIYADATGDQAWLQKHMPDFRAIFDFYRGKMHSGLIEQNEHADWQDSAKRKGKTFFTNLLYYHAARDYGFLSEAELKAFGERMMQAFYDEKTGLFRSIAGRDNISLEGILWAIENKLLVDPRELYRNLAKHELFIRYHVPGFATYPSYNDDDMYIQVKVVGLREYHGNLFWSWLMSYAGKVAFLQGDRATYEKIRANLQRTLERDGTVYEIYQNTPSNPHFETWLYKSEAPFSWGAGFILDMFKTAGAD